MRPIFAAALIAVVATPAYSECKVDPNTGLISCPGGPLGGIDGGYLHKEHDFERLLENPNLVLNQLRIPPGMDAAAKAVTRQELEKKRENIEEFRVWAEKDISRLNDNSRYKAAIEIYKEGILQYKLNSSSLK